MKMENMRDLGIQKIVTKNGSYYILLINVGEPYKVSEEFIRVQDEFLKNECKEKGIVELEQKNIFEAMNNFHKLIID